MEVYLCQLCKEPIANFVCIECLAADIGTWLPGPLSSSFNRFTSRLLAAFHYPHNDVDSHIGHTVKGFMCSSKGRGSVCLYCYLNEVYQWLKGEDGVMAERFVGVFHFGRKEVFTDVLVAQPEPILADEHLMMDGLCEECDGEAVVRYTDGFWLCEECQEP